eukprot:m.69062 g.69062  ORF g.69062 m.69062 type:complete len:958 (+) comp12025_c0_seq1:199-3072(+)
MSSDYKLELEAHQAAFTDELIKKLVGLKPNDHIGNFARCREYVSSNFKNHNYLDPNWHNIKKVLHRLHEKFYAHSLQDASALLKEGVDKLFNLQEDREKTTAIITFLLNVSESPTASTTYVEHITNLSSQTKADSDSEDDTYSNPSSGEDWGGYESDWSQLSDLGTQDFLEDEQTPTRPLPEKLLTIESELSDVIPVQEKFPTCLEERYDINEQDTSAQQARVQRVNLELSQHKCLGALFSTKPSDLSSLWCDPVPQSVEGLLRRKFFTTLKEYQVVRETIWMLFGAETYVYKHISREDCDIITPRDDIQLSHITPGCLNTFLTGFAAQGTKINKITDFIEKSMDKDAPKTFQAFGSALKQHLKTFRGKLQSLEHNTDTLLRLKYGIRNEFSEVNFVYTLLENTGILMLKKHKDNWANSEKCTKLLSALYELSFEIEQQNQDTVSFLHSLFIKSMKPLCEFLDEWMSEGVVNDAAGEYPIRSRYVSKFKDFGVWRERYQLRTTQPLNETDHQDPACIPIFLMPFIREVLVTGKVSWLLSEISEDPEQEFVPLIDRIRWALQTVHTPSHEPNRQVDASSALSMKSEDTSLMDAIHEFFPRMNLIESKTEAKEYEHTSTFSWQRGTKLLHALRMEVLARYQARNDKLFKVLRDQHNIFQHLRNLQDYFLFASGEVMHSVLCQIFEKSFSNKAWWDVASLSAILNSVLREQGKSHLSSCLTLNLKENVKGKPRSQGLSLFEYLTLNYELKWPISLVVSSRAMEIYKEVFSFLVKIKWAKWNLDEIRSRHIEQECASSKDLVPILRRLYFLRMKILNAVNHLNSFIMTRIVESLRNSLSEKLSQAEDIDGYRSASEWFVDTVYERCLLSASGDTVCNALMQIFEIAIEYKALWDRATKGSTQDLHRNLHTCDVECQKLSKRFSNACRLVIAMLDTLVRRGSYAELGVLYEALKGFEPNRPL